ncbi:MAG: DUF4954 family protein [Treponema sp.]|jgi:hypothetical protein|nr:DUF4954 family protein [Treponema sp.]
MERAVSVLPSERYGYDFIPAEFLPPGKDEYWLRNKQAAQKPWRNLEPGEIERLTRNGNFSGGWNHVLVSDPFDPMLIKNSSFYGLVRIGSLENVLLLHHDFKVPSGIRNSTLVSCDAGDNVSIQDCSLISHYIIGDYCILSRIDELVTSNHAKFGRGVVKEGEDEDVRVWIDVMNEAGGRSILPFEEMICADAFLWAARRDDRILVERLKALTQRGKEKRGSYGIIGAGSVLKSCRIIKDTAVGEGAYIKGANKLKNLTILSSEEEPAQIGEGVELVNGIVGYGSRVFYGSKAVRFVIGKQCNLKYGARLIHSVLGDNSTVSCCEILNNLVFPVHEQHHNNSFLIASLVQGMSNMAAGATIGSNHNSRANDGEIRAARGFWPGLSVTLKHSSRFASFCLIVKGDYPYELNITLPFSLVNNNVRRDRLEVMPAYFWMYNLYALERNSWKTRIRDKRRHIVQRIETDYLAPDTAEEIIAALEQLEAWMRAAGTGLPNSEKTEFPSGAGEPDSPAVSLPGDDEDPEYDYSSLGEDVLAAPGLERHRRGTVILKPSASMAAYREMLFYYGMKTVVEYLAAQSGSCAGNNAGDIRFSLSAFTQEMERLRETGRTVLDGAPAEGGSPERVKDWVNLGGQICPAFRLDRLGENIKNGTIADWEGVHHAYDEMAAAYGNDKLRHGYDVLAWLAGTKAHPLSSREGFMRALDRAGTIQEKIAEQVYLSRAKDFHDPFRGITYRNKEEMEAVAGTAEDNAFVRMTCEKAAAFKRTLGELKQRLERGGASAAGQTENPPSIRPKN